MTHEKLKVGFEGTEQTRVEQKSLAQVPRQFLYCARLSAYLAGVLKPPDLFLCITFK